MDHAHSLIPFQQLLAITGLSRAGAYRAINAGEFQKVVLSPRRTAFIEAEVRAWVKSKIDSSKKAESDERRRAVIASTTAATAASVAARKLVSERVRARAAKTSGT